MALNNNFLTPEIERLKETLLQLKQLTTTRSSEYSSEELETLVSIISDTEKELGDLEKELHEQSSNIISEDQY